MMGCLSSAGRSSKVRFRGIAKTKDVLEGSMAHSRTWLFSVDRDRALRDRADVLQCRNHSYARRARTNALQINFRIRQMMLES